MATALGVMRRVRSHGRGGVLVLEGEPGIGKSAVFAAITEQAAAAQFTCGVGKADQIGRISPAAPLLLALRSGARPVLSAAELAGLAARTAEPLLLLEEVTGLLELRSQNSPLLIGIDDTQWADPVSHFVLRALPSRLAGSAIMWLFASRRPGEGLAEDLKRPGFAGSRTDVVELSPLSPADIAALAQDRLHGPPSAGLSRMLDGVGGNPFFATQILEGVVRAGTQDDPDIPAEFVLGVRRRLGELGPATAELMTVAAVFGQPLAAEDARALLPAPSRRADHPQPGRGSPLLPAAPRPGRPPYVPARPDPRSDLRRPDRAHPPGPAPALRPLPARRGGGAADHRGPRPGGYQPRRRGDRGSPRRRGPPGRRGHA